MDDTDLPNPWSLLASALAGVWSLIADGLAGVWLLLSDGLAGIWWLLVTGLTYAGTGLGVVILFVFVVAIANACLNTHTPSVEWDVERQQDASVRSVLPRRVIAEDSERQAHAETQRLVKIREVAEAENRARTVPVQVRNQRAVVGRAPQRTPRPQAVPTTQQNAQPTRTWLTGEATVLLEEGIDGYSAVAIGVNVPVEEIERTSEPGFQWRVKAGEEAELRRECDGKSDMAKREGRKAEADMVCGSLRRVSGRNLTH